MAAACIDPAQLDSLRGSMSAEDFRTLMTLFAVDLNERLVALVRAQESLERAQLTHQAHQVVGAAANLGAVELTAAARQLEDIAETASPDAIDAAVANLATLAAAALAELDRLVPGGP